MSTINSTNSKFRLSSEPSAASFNTALSDTLVVLDDIAQSERLEYQDFEKVQRMLAMHAGGHFIQQKVYLDIRLVGWAIHSRLYGVTKRVLDIFLSSIAFIILLPLMLIAALAIKLDSPGPILFRQQRVGKWGRTFDCFKFRSMYIDAEARKSALVSLNEADEVVFKMKRDPRVTRVGRFIRKFSIDELPQLINVLRGEMSLVGPRPPVPFEVAQYAYDQYRRLDATPGITGLQQISGRSELTFKRWVELDLEYIEQQSLGKDIEILLKTIPAVISTRGAY